jgi:putative aldouronate transport system substrate-binding protein
MSTVQSQTLEFILGKRPLSQWDQYVSEVSSQGASQFLSIYNQAYSTYKQAHG